MEYLTWAGMVIVSLVMVMVMVMGGVAKLSGNPMVLKSFSDLGFPGWFGTFVGVAELAGAVGIWIRLTSLWAALGIAVVMVGAIYYHIAYPPLGAGVPALVILGICGFIIARRGTGVIG